ncbi:efflux RND transporter permease subunit [Cryomorpha ignava]|uniref:Efflux RND transporter permease subunit n=1 Tax=Cryomorpha ignava TaxID=101383 RepID=A0A7K3WQI4_9FLAO|nr:efflux RND transporter permease subunit [Cryomorpha ignava]NEN23142.1 efflux RND transporter permease subunit [Cryomorpha ignava]
MAKKHLEKGSKGYKEFGLSSLSVENRTTVIVLAVIILIGGVFSYLSMPKENFPDVVTPEIYVGTAYPGNSPLDIEKLITRPFEKEINAISGVDEINSTSTQGFSSIQVKFNFDISPEEALRKVKDKIDVAMSDRDFPTDLPADPNVFELNFSELIPIMNINLSGDYSIDQLKTYAEYLEDAIEDLPEITKVEIRGVMDKEVKINANLLAMEAMEISFDDIANAISSENTTISGGDLLVDDMRRNVRVIGEFKDVEKIGNIIVKRENQEVVYLKDVADISFGEKEKESYAREYGNPVVMIDIMKRAGENLIEASENISKIVDEAKANQFPEDLKISITNDTSDQTRTQVDELVNSIIFGVLLVVGVLLFFLGLRNALFVGIAIPLSMLMSFLILGALGVSLNVIVLFALILALGMLVDNGIVVVENVYRLMDEGYTAKEAAKLGVGEVAVPIIASTATTLAAFLPLAFWPGMMGEFMFYLPITLIIVLTSSLFVALVINPVLTAMYMKTGEPDINKRRMVRNSLIFIVIGIVFDAVGLLSEAKGFITLGNLLLFIGAAGLLNVYVLTPGTIKFQNQILPKMENGYQRFLTYALKGARPYGFLIGTFLLLIVSFVLLSVFPPKVDFFPVNEPQYLNIFIEKPIGTDIEETNRTTIELEKKVMSLLDKYFTTNENGERESFLIKSVIAQVGEGASDPAQGNSAAQTPHKSRITVQFSKFQDRQGISTGDVLEEIRKDLKGYPGTQISVSKNEAGPPQGAPINIEVTGDDYEKLMDDAEGLRAFIDERNVAGIEELKLDVETGKPEMPIIIDREKARRLNLSTYQIGDALRTALFGREVSTYKEGEDDYPINVRLQKRFRDSEDALMNMRLTFRNQSSGKIVQVPISSVAHAEKSSTFSAVKRKELDRVITITSNVLTGYNANEIVARLKSFVGEYDKHQGTEISFTGQQEEQAKEMDFLSTALALALFLIILIITAQFNAISTPFIIFFAVIFSLIGVLLGLVIFQMDFVIVMTMIGIISLAGIVVNNAIVLIDYTNLIRSRLKDDMDIDQEDTLPFQQTVIAVIEGGKTRLRPVLLTAITTVLGLVPLAIGLNINFFTLVSEFDPQIYVGGDNVMFWGPIAWTIIFGLTFATFLTLVIVPVMYLLLAKMKYRLVYKKDTSYDIEA